jgi:deazaflavin-dependent oxidoreductase (nitroreductase family)
MSQSTPTVPSFVTETIKFLLHSPMHGMVSKTVLLITFTGRKSGKSFSTPVDYSQEGDHVTIFSHASWWKNLRAAAPVTVLIQGRKLKGLAEPVADDKQAVAVGLAAHLRKVPSDARYYGVTFDENRNPRADEIEKAVQTVVMIRVRLC